MIDQSSIVPLPTQPHPEAQSVQIQREATSSIEVTRNAKGDYQWVIKRYYAGGTEIDVDPESGILLDPESWTALQEIKRVDELLRQHFLPNGAS